MLRYQDISPHPSIQSHFLLLKTIDMLAIKHLGLLALGAMLVHASVINQIDFISPKALSYSKNTLKASDKNLVTLKNTADNYVQSSKTFSVVHSKILPPSNNKHDYYSWAPYFWPNCPGGKLVKNYMHVCLYVDRDGQFNPDLGNLTDGDYLKSMLEQSTNTALAYYMFDDEKYAKRAATLLRTWFINNSTRMNPNCKYVQVVRGPPAADTWIGRQEGVLDMRGLVYVAAVEPLLRKSVAWTTADQQALSKWFGKLANWYATSSQGKGEAKAKNNHESFFIAQHATFLYYSGQHTQAKAAIQSFLDGDFQKQIIASGEQPLEAVRTRPFHYRCFNLEALIYIAQLGDQLGMKVWHAKTASGATIQTAVDYVIKTGPGSEDPAPFGRLIYSTKNAYGDPTGKYAAAFKKYYDSLVTTEFYLWDLPIKQEVGNSTVNTN